MTTRRRLAIVTTHPIQYHAPWFRWIATHDEFLLKVFYTWDFGIAARPDPGFGRDIQWDIPLLDGYESEFVPNVSHRPGTQRYFGMRNPGLRTRLQAFGPDAALLIGYKHASFMRLIFTRERARGFPLLFRGDSHRIGNTETVKHKLQALNAAIRRRTISEIYRRFAAFLYVGKANRDYFLMHCVPEDRLFFAPHAVDNERFMSAPVSGRPEGMKWRAELGIPASDLLVLFAGKFEDKKRPLDLLEAFAGLKLRDASLLFVGSGHLEQQLRRRASSVPKVFFAPFQNQSEMPRTYAACDLLVLPSYGSEETWGLAINEALCLRRAVIVSSHVGCGPDLVQHGVNGLVFPAGDITALTEVLREALADRQRLVDWGEAGYKIVSEYNYGRATAGLQEAFTYATSLYRRA